jgi:hypothetical protein
MKCQVVGIQNVSGTNKAGQSYSGTKFFLNGCLGDPSQSRIDGVEAFDVYMNSASVPADVRVGDVVELYYNRYGRVAQMVVADEI